MNVFAKRFKESRVNNNLTQEELSVKLNITKSAICKYETGTNKANIDMLILISKVLNVSIDYLLGLTNNPEINK